MTLNQLHYVTTVADSGTITEAANKLFISQPSLTSAIHSLEKELNITIFYRTNKGISITTEGEEFLGYARQMLEQEKSIAERYTGEAKGKKIFCISTQHYSFVVEAFVDLLKNYNRDSYEFHIRETQTYMIIEDVSRLRSEIGVLYINDYNKAVLTRTFHEHNLEFTPLFTAKPHVFLYYQHPLASKKSLEISDLDEYPRLTYEQGEHNAFYFFEEIQSPLEHKKDIVVTDRATLFNLLIGLNGYTICSGVINPRLNGENIISVPLNINDFIQIGYLTHKHIKRSSLGEKYIAMLKSASESAKATLKN